MDTVMYYTATPENQTDEYEMVMSTDYEAACDERDAAVDELAALREELAKRDSRINELAQECSDLSGELALFKSSDMMGSVKSWLDSKSAKVCDALQQRLTAAEQRNAQASSILNELRYDPRLWLMVSSDTALKIGEFLKAQPTESGASG